MQIMRERLRLKQCYPRNWCTIHKKNFTSVDISGPKNYSMEWNGMWNTKKLMEWKWNEN
jgi:hypothetical protein